MTVSARVASPADLDSYTTLAVLVRVVDGSVTLPTAVSAHLSGRQFPPVMSAQWCADQGMTSSAGSAIVLRSFEGGNVVLVSLGAAPTPNDFRVAGAGLWRAAGRGPIGVLWPIDEVEDPGNCAQALIEGVTLSSYGYKDVGTSTVVDVIPVGDTLPSVASHDELTDAIERGGVIGDAVNWAKHLVNRPAGSLPPKELARALDERLATDEHVTVEVWTESRIKDERLGGLLGVGRGSAQPTRLVYATYDPRPGASLVHVVLVGKGVTFDSGGLSMKSPEAMMTMKTDMTGAAVVMAALSLASRLGLGVRVTAITPLTENLVGGRATKPGDVLTIRNGMTIEVLNTDAEGRLILADGLSLAAELSPDAIIDVATLTGAQRVALGDEVGALFASNDELADALAAAGERCGESLWRLPLVQRYESHLDSEVADMKNIGKPASGGAIIAALLLQRFSAGRPWAHLDIAGPARADSAYGFVTKGATAFGVRTLVEYLGDVATRD